MMATFKLFTLMSALLFIILSPSADGVTVKIEVRSFPFLNRIFLNCLDDQNANLETNNIGLIRTYTLDGQLFTETFTDFTIEELGVVKFTVTPETEGNYSCVDKDINTTSSNSVKIVAYPSIDPSYTLPQTHRAQVGTSSPPIQCPFPVGILSSEYEVIWFRGIKKLNSSDTKYEILSNFSLIIHNTDLSDTSSGYFCQINVRNENAIGKLNEVFTQYGPDTSLTIYGDFDLVPKLQNTAVLPGSTAMFTCTIESAPQGSIRWLMNGKTDINDRFTIQPDEIESSPSSITLSSTLIISDAIPEDTSELECVAYVDNGEEMLLKSEKATFIVIDNNFIPMLEFTSNGRLNLSIVFPGVILDIFTLHIRYINTADIHNTYERTLSDSSFIDKSIIDDYQVPIDQVPSFLSFTVQVALEVYGVMGEYSDESEFIYSPDPSTTTSSTTATTTTTVTPNTQPNTSNCSCTSPISLYIVIGTLCGLCLLLIVLLIMLFCYYFVASKNKYHAAVHERSLRTLRENHDYDTAYGVTQFGGSREGMHSSPSHSSHSTRGTTSPSTTSHTHTHSSSTGHSLNTHSYTPSRPSSQESYTTYEGHSVTASPPPKTHVYDKIKEPVPSVKKDSNLPTPERSTEKKIQQEISTSTIAVGTSPPKEFFVDSLNNGDSKSPKSRKKLTVSMTTTSCQTNGTGESDYKPNSITPLSPSRSDPSLESSMKSTTSDHTPNPGTRTGFSSSMAIPVSSKRDQQTLTSPSLENRSPLTTSAIALVVLHHLQLLLSLIHISEPTRPY